MISTILRSNQSNKFFLLLIGAAIFLIGCAKNDVPENYLARVGDKYITTDDLKFLSIINPDGKVSQGQLQGFLNNWVNSEVLAQQALKEDLDKDPYLKNRLASFKRKLLADTYIRYNVYKNLAIPDSAIQNYYDQHKQVFMWENDGAQVTQYFSTSRDTAQEIYKVLRYGSQAEKSLLYQRNHPETKVVTQKDLILALSDAVFSTRALGVLSPIKSEFGYHVIVVNNRYRAGSYQDLEQVRDEVRERLLIIAQKKHYYAILDSLKGVTDIEINTSLFKNFAQDTTGLSAE